ncbi:hypothetical protein NDU88_007229 [Pleurodeles waltl]|uniref:Uncharacterized protein n=1 Tax=Pleurodeles waltl TaxID=8319 RepID=A0AAV7N1N9_PLEWA|nr:hypothetical protein NDU88_007229 [Pleurodeles waltl]
MASTCSRHIYRVGVPGNWSHETQAPDDAEACTGPEEEEGRQAESLPAVAKIIKKIREEGTPGPTGLPGSLLLDRYFIQPVYRM